jgi:hypothetical protein
MKCTKLCTAKPFRAPYPWAVIVTKTKQWPQNLSILPECTNKVINLGTCSLISKLFFCNTSLLFSSMRHRDPLPVCLGTRFIITIWILQPITFHIATAMTRPKMLDPRVRRQRVFGPTSRTIIRLLILDILPHAPTENLEATPSSIVRVVSMIV